MREKIRDRGRLEHIIEQLHNLDEFLCDKSFEDLQNDKILQYAVIKSVEIIGEASYMLSSAFKEQHTEIAWNEIVKMRHVLVHGYYHISIPMLWSIVQEDLPELSNHILSILEADNCTPPKTNDLRHRG